MTEFAHASFVRPIHLETFLWLLVYWNLRFKNHELSFNVKPQLIRK
jgi:hypothetical protein